MTEPDPRLGYAQSRLVRPSVLREDAVPGLDAAGAAIVLIAGDRVVLAGTGTALLAASQAPAGGAALYLGRVDGRPVFAAALPAEAAEMRPTRDLRGLAAEGVVPAHELGLLATARALLSWHARHGFCAQCGSATQAAGGGYRRECGTCGTQHFPRTDPVVIMLVARGETCLLGRAPRFPEGMYSCLAGFLEPGETIEAAVRRETLEEAGLRVGAVRYRASQPWPFPSSLMIGCTAEALDETVAIDPAELDDARWFGRSELARMIAGTHPEGFSVPPPMAIAHLLMRDFVDGRD